MLKEFLLKFKNVLFVMLLLTICNISHANMDMSMTMGTGGPAPDGNVLTWNDGATMTWNDGTPITWND